MHNVVLDVWGYRLMIPCIACGISLVCCPPVYVCLWNNKSCTGARASSLNVLGVDVDFGALNTV